MFKMSYMGILKKISEYLLSVVLFSVVLCLVGFIVLYQSNYIHKLIHDRALTQLSVLFQSPPEIGGIDGSLASGIVLHHVRVFGKDPARGAVMTMDRLTIRYNPLSLLFSRKSGLRAITSIDVDTAQLNVTHQKNGAWNLMEILVPTKSKKPSVFSDFRGKITIRHLYAVYQDEVGWNHSQPLQHPFQEVLRDCRVRLKVGWKKKASVELVGLVGKTSQPVHLGGWVHLKTGAYAFQFKSGPLPMDQWGPYTYPYQKEGYLATKGTAQVIRGSLGSLDRPARPGHAPFKYDLTIRFNGSQLKLPFFRDPLTEVYGDIRVTNPFFRLLDVRCQLSDTPWVGVGDINHDTATMNFHLVSDGLDIGRIGSVFPDIRHWPMSGKAAVVVDMVGPSHIPHISGTLQANSVVFLGMPFQKMALDFNWVDKRLSFRTRNGFLAGGPFQGVATVNFATHIPEVSGVFSGHRIQPSTISLPFALPKTSLCDVKIQLSGYTRSYRLDVGSTAKNMVVLGQSLTGFSGHFLVENGGAISIKDTSLYINNGQAPIELEGRILPDGAAQFHYHGRKIPLSDPDYARHPSTRHGSATLHGQVKATLDRQFWVNPLQRLSGLLYMDSAHQPFFGFLADSCQVDLELNQGAIQVQRLSLKKEGGSDLRITGGLFKDGSFDLMIRQSQVDLADFQDYFRGKRILGKAVVSGHVWGKHDAPNLNIEFNSSRIQFQDVMFDRARGSIGLKGDELSIANLQLEDGDNRYHITGNINIKSLNQYDVSVRLLNVQLESCEKLATRVMGGLLPKSGDGVVMTSATPQENKTISMGHVGGGSSTLSQNLMAYQSVLNRSIQLTPPPLGSPLFSGRISGVVGLRSSDSLPMVEADLVIDRFRWDGYFYADQLRILAARQKDRTRLDIKASQGKVGNLPFQRLDSQGELDTLRANLTFHSTYLWRDKVRSSNIFFGSVSLMPWSSGVDGPLDLNLRLHQDDLGILTVLSPTILSIQNDGDVQLALTGSCQHPVISAPVLALKNTRLSFSDDALIHGQLIIPSANLTLNQNVLHIAHLPLRWKEKEVGVFSRAPYDNQVILSGDIQVASLNLLSPDILALRMRLHVTPTVLFVQIPNLYRGQAQLSDTVIEGVYRVGLTKKAIRDIAKTRGTRQESGPTIQGAVVLQDGRIFVDTSSQRAPKPAFKLDVDFGVSRNVLIEGSLLGNSLAAGFANSLLLELAVTEEPLKITGTLNAPRITNRLLISRGQGTFLSRAFEVLEEDKQPIFYLGSPDKIGPNSVRFESRSSDGIYENLVPIFNVKAIATIENFTVSLNKVVSQESDISPYTGVMLVLRGPVDDLQSVRFEQYRMNSLYVQSANPIYVRDYQLIGANGQIQRSSDFDALIQTMLPELSLDPSQARQGTTTSLLNNVGENRLNLFFRGQVFRPIEKRIAKTTGLYDVRIDYNAGSALLNTNGGASTTGQAVGINFVSNLIAKKLFLRVRTDLDFRSVNTNQTTTQSNIRLSEFELTYYLLQNLSMNYANFSQNDTTSLGYIPRLSIRYVHEF